MKVKHKTQVEDFYPWIRGQLVEIDDPDKAWDFLNIAIMNGTITPGKAQKMFDRRFPAEALENWRKFLVQTAMETDPELAKLKAETLAKREEAIKNLGFTPEEFEKEMERRLLEKNAASTQ
jgi:hypothetical protein